jgi:molybdenum cofactor guanylyltransferase
MGRDKALLECEGRRWIERSVTLLDELCGEVLLACGSEPRYEDLGRALVLDPEPDMGPLAGLCEGLAASKSKRVLALAVDMQRLDRHVLDHLVEQAEAHDADVALYEVDGRPQPLCAAYHQRALPAIRFALAKGERRMVAFWDGTRTDGAPLVVLRLSGNEQRLSNWNRPEDVA